MKRKAVRKTPIIRRKPRKKGVLFSGKLLRFLIIGFLILLFLGIGYHYRNGLLYYLGFKSYKLKYEQAEAKRISDIRNFQVLQKHKGNAIGLDVSEYQGTINWEFVENIENEFPIEFIMIRATAGNDRSDKQFIQNWIDVKKKNLIRGAYHYYRPNENSLLQAKLFIKTVKLEKGDLPPVLDIEKLPKGQSLDSLKIGLKRWLKTVEAHYKVKPIIYTSEKYYDDFLKKDFSNYLFWIANYNFYREKIGDEWLFWQFTELATIPGIDGNVDVNIFNGDLEQLRFITME
jgi:lysozyme